MVKISWHKYQLDNRKCYEGRVNGEIWYDFTVYRTNKHINLTYSRYAGLPDNDRPIYYKFRDTNDVQFVKSMCFEDANGNDKALIKYRDTELYELHERTSKVMADANDIIKRLRAIND